MREKLHSEAVNPTHSVSHNMYTVHSQLQSRNRTTSPIHRGVNVQRVTAVTTMTSGPTISVDTLTSRKKKLLTCSNSAKSPPARLIQSMCGTEERIMTATLPSSTKVTVDKKTDRTDEEFLFGNLPARVYNLLTCDSIDSFFIDLDHLHSYMNDIPPKWYAKSSSLVYSTNTIFLIELDNALSPCTVLLVKTIDGQDFNYPLRALFDSGSDSSHIQRRALPEGAGSSAIAKPKAIVGMTGTAIISHEVELQDILLPEFSQSLRISDPFKCYVMDNKSVYDIILGRDFLMSVGIDILHSTQEMKWLDTRLPFRNRDSIQDPFDLNTSLLETLTGDMEGLERAYILDAKYEAFDPHAVAKTHTHLTPQQRVQLGELLADFPQLFDGKLRTYPPRKVHIEI